MDDTTPNDSEKALPPDPDAATPAEAEENGPIPALIAASAAEVQAEALPGDHDEADAVLASMGVESESVEAGQILGLVIATVVSILALSVVLIFLFYMPARTGSIEAAEGTAQYPELQASRSDGLAKLSQFTRADSAYTQTIGSAMAAVVSAYGGKTDAIYQAEHGMPISRGRLNEYNINRGMGSAIQTQSSVQAAPDSSAGPAPAPPEAVGPVEPPAPETTPSAPDEIPS